MKHKNSLNAPIFVEYNDNNLEHVKAGPDYGQPSSRSCWEETDSIEYPDYVEHLKHLILTNDKIKIII